MKISVVIPTHNRPFALKNCLVALEATTFPRDEMEVIIVDDNGSTDLSDIAMSVKIDVRVVRLDVQSGPGIARNAGVNISSGELIAFTDDDCLPDANWLSALWTGHQQHPNAMLGGRLVNSQTQFIASIANQVVSDIVYSHYNASSLQSRFFSTNNVAVPRALFTEMGGFDPEFSRASEDRDLCDRWRALGLPMVLLPDAVVAHDKSLTVRHFLRQHFRYGTGAHTYHRARSSRGAGSITQEMSFHAELPRLVRKHLRGFSWADRVRILPLLAGWQVANAGGYFWQAARASLRKSTAK